MLNSLLKVLCFSSLLNYFITDLYAQDIYQQYCLSDSKNAKSLLLKLNSIKLPAESVSSSGHCIDLFIFAKRENLYHKYIKLNFPSAKYMISENENKICKIEILKTLKAKENTSNLVVNHSSKIQSIQRSENILSTTQLNIQNGKTGSFQAELNHFLINCQVKQNLYSLDIKLSDPKINLSTSAVLKVNQTFDLGSFNDRVNKEKLKLGLPLNISSQQSLNGYSYKIRLRP